MSTTDTPADEPTIEAASDGADAEPRLTADQIFDLLRSERRRTVLRYLRDEEGPVSVVDLAERVAAREHDTTVRALASAERERVSVSLCHSHLPKLAEAGVVEYDRDRDVVERRPRADRLDQHFPSSSAEAGDETGETADRDAWDGYFLGASGCCAALLAGTAFGVTPLTSLSGVALAAVILTVFTALTATKIAMSGGTSTE